MSCKLDQVILLTPIHTEGMATNWVFVFAPTINNALRLDHIIPRHRNEQEFRSNGYERMTDSLLLLVVIETKDQLH